MLTPLCVDEAPCLEPSLDDSSTVINILCQEIELRKKLKNSYKGRLQESHGDALSEGRWVCSLCKQNCHFSVMFCSQHQDRVTCVRHPPEQVCSCATENSGNIVLYTRHEDKALSDAVRELRTRQRGQMRANTGAASMIRAAQACLPSQKDDPMLKPTNKRALPSSDTKSAPKAKSRRLSVIQPIQVPCLHQVYKQRRIDFVTAAPVVVFDGGGVRAL
jgi:hypothetical protein